MALYGIRSAHKAKELNTHSLDRSISFSATITDHLRNTSPGSSRNPSSHTETSAPTDKSYTSWNDLTHKLPFPPILECLLIVQLKEERRTYECNVPWMEPEQYKRVMQKCKDLLHVMVERHNPPLLETFLKTGLLKLFAKSKTSEDRSLLALERWHYDHDWVLHVPTMALKYGLKYHPDQQLILEVLWDCDYIPAKVDVNLTLRKHIFMLIKQRLEQNKCWGDKDFLSRKEVKYIFTDQVVEDLIRSDDDLHRSQAAAHLFSDKYATASAELRKFVINVQLTGTRLLAICIYGLIPFECLYKLIQCGKQDVDLPIDILPQSMSGTECDHILKYQEQFIPFDFHRVPNDGARYRTLTKNTVVPIFEKGRLGEGGYGEVFEVEIHPEHHDFTPVCR
jgi:hypothetical protein